MYYNYFRDYDPSTARYIQADPIGVTKDFSNPQLQVAIKQGVNLQGSTNLHDPFRLNHTYGYTDQNPLNSIDPFGLYNGEVTNGSAWSGYNSGDASAFPGSMNDSGKQECMTTCMNREMAQPNVACNSFGEVLSRRATPIGGMAASLTCGYAVSRMTCSTECNNECPRQ